MHFLSLCVFISIQNNGRSIPLSSLLWGIFGYQTENLKEIEAALIRLYISLIPFMLYDWLTDWLTDCLKLYKKCWSLTNFMTNFYIYIHVKIKTQSPGRNIFVYLGSQTTKTCSKRLLQLPISESTALDLVTVGWENIFTKQKG